MQNQNVNYLLSTLKWKLFYSSMLLIASISKSRLLWISYFSPPCLLRKRVTSEQWLIRDLGAYLPGVYEEVCNQSSLAFCDQITGSKSSCKQDVTKYMFHSLAGCRYWVCSHTNRDNSLTYESKTDLYWCTWKEEVSSKWSFFLKTVIFHIIISYYYFIFSVIYSFRNAGDEWLVTFEDTEMYIPEVSEVSFK